MRHRLQRREGEGGEEGEAEGRRQRGGGGGGEEGEAEGGGGESREEITHTVYMYICIV